jgi:hypothetical protein
MGAYTLVIMDDVKLIHFLKRELIHYNSIIAKKTDVPVHVPVPVPVGVDLDNDELD